MTGKAELTKTEKNVIRQYITKIREGTDNPLIGPQEMGNLMGFTRPRAYAVLSGLMEKKLLDRVRRKGFVLTDYGRQEIDDLIHRSKVMETFFHTELGIDLDTAEQDAQHMVLHVSDDLINAICDRLDQPTECPHNYEIPHQDTE